MLRAFMVFILLLPGLWASVQAQDEEKRRYPLLSNRFSEGYLVNLEGDTAYGYIRPGNTFRDQMKVYYFDYYGGRTFYRGDRIRGYGYEELHYTSFATPYNFSDAFTDSTIFLLRVVNGPAKLYRFYTRRSMLTLQRGPAYLDLLVKPDGGQYEISYAFRWKRLSNAFEDHPTLSDDIAEELYRPEDTEEIVRTYNEWYRQQHSGGGAMGE